MTNYFLFELPFFAPPLMLPPEAAFFLCLRCRFLAAGFLSPVFEAVAAGFAAGFLAGAFLF